MPNSIQEPICPFTTLMKPTIERGREWSGLRAEKRDYPNHVTTLQRRSLPASTHVGTLRHLSALSSPHLHLTKRPQTGWKKSHLERGNIVSCPYSPRNMLYHRRKNAAVPFSPVTGMQRLPEDVPLSTRSPAELGGASQWERSLYSCTSCFSAVYQRVWDVTSAFSAALPARERLRRPSTQSDRKKVTFDIHRLQCASWLGKLATVV